MILEIISGRKIIGYGIKAKLQDLGVYHLMSFADLTAVENCAVIFNKDGKKDP
jgi:hypothetical protein